MKTMAVKILGNHRYIGLSPAPPIDEGLSDLISRIDTPRQSTTPSHSISRGTAPLLVSSW